MNRCWRQILSVAVVIAALACAVEAGSVRARDGRRLDGAVRWDEAGNVVVVQSSGRTEKLALSDVSDVQFSPQFRGVAAGGSLPAGWAVQDIGNTPVAGSAAYREGTFALRGAGNEIGNGSDSFHYVWQPLPGDGQLVVRVAGMSDGEPLAKAGIMIRNQLTPESRMAALVVSPGQGVQFITRTNQEASALSTPADGPRARPPVWLKILKVGNLIIGAQSADGKRWDHVGRIMVDGSFREGCIGLVVASHQDFELATARFDHVQLSVHGLRGEYFGDSEFKDLRTSRLDAWIWFNWGNVPPTVNMPADDYTVRWTGQIEPPSSDVYSFNPRAAGAARVWIDGHLIVDTHSRVPRSGTVRMEVGHRYDLRVDYYKSGGIGDIVLFWSSSVQELQPVPSSALYYAPEAVAVPAAAANPSTQAAETLAQPTTATSVQSRGVLLVDGTFLPGIPTRLDEKNVVLSYQGRTDMTLALTDVAAVLFQPPPSELADKLPAKSAGLLLAGGDFVEGEAKAFGNGALEMSSVLFGLRRFDTRAEAVALVIRPVEPARSGYVLRTARGGVLQAKSIAFRAGNLILDQPTLGRFVVPSEDVVALESH